MFNDSFQERTKNLIGEDGITHLNSAVVAVFGLGGVGSFTCEALARSGIGTLILTDFDTVDITNLNRQLYALNSTIGLKKVDAAKQRVLDINPDITLHLHPEFVDESNLHIYDTYSINAIVDCIDSVESKAALIEYAHKREIYTVSSMGAARKLDPFKIQHADISKTNYCPLAKIMRKKLKQRGIYTGVETVFSTEESKPHNPDEGELGSISYLPSMFGLAAASLVIKHLI